MYSRTLIAEVVFDTVLSHVDRQCFLFDTVFSHVDRCVFFVDAVFSYVSDTESRWGGASIKSIGSLRGGAPHKYAGEGGSGGEGSSPLPPNETQSSNI